MSSKTNNIVSFSGGLGSAVTAILAWQNNISHTCVFADTLIEDEDLYRFMTDIENLTGKSIIRLSAGLTPWDIYIKKKFIGNSRTAHCSSELKTKVVKDYIYANHNPSTVVMYLGMGVEEYERVERAEKVWEPISVQSLLVQLKYSSKEKQLSLLKKYNIDPPRLYDYGFPHNNCGGFCCRAGLKQFHTLLLNFPERFEHHCREEERAFAAIGPTARPFLSYTKDKVKHYIRLTEFRELILSGKLKVEPYDYGGCGCFIDEMEQ